MNGIERGAVRTIEEVRDRLRRLAGRQLAARMAAGIAVIWLAAWMAERAGSRAAMSAAAAAAVAATASAIWCAWVVRRRRPVPDARRVARFVEERYPDLDDRLVTAIDREAPGSGEDAFRARQLSDADRAVAAVSPDEVVPDPALKRAALAAAGAAVGCVVAAVLWVQPGQRALQAIALHLFPDRYPLVVTPGDARVKPGEAFTIRAAAAAPLGEIVPQLHVRVGEDGRSVPMRHEGNERYAWRFDSVPASFTYEVSAAGRRSERYSVTLLQQPRVRRIDLHYRFPAYTRLEPRTDEDGGDIYAPAGTQVRVSVESTKPLGSGALVLGDGQRLALRMVAPDRAEAELTVRADGAYRVALADLDGLSAAGETEYFIRVLNDRPANVRIVRPARDRQVTPLEEVAIEARADDDYGIESLDLVFSVRGGREQVVPLSRGERLPTATGRRTLFLEELDVEPGDFVTYYARARDIGRGRAASESRSDIYFLEVTPFEEEFAAAQSQAMAGGSGDQALDSLVAAQKEIIVATWKLERRAGAGRSAADIQTVGRAQGELRQRALTAAQRLSSSQRRLIGPGRADPDEDGTGSSMTQAAAAMGRAEARLVAGDTARAIPPEMESLNHLLKIQAEVRRREVARQQAGAGAGGSRADQDLSSLFDRELRRQQQTNYETPRSTQEHRDAPENDVLERVRELARRQEQLARRQDELMRERDRLSAEELRRQLERLARDQAELRRLAEQAAQQASRSSSSSDGNSSGQGSAGSQLREASEEMRRAAGEMRRDAPDSARTRSQRALERLRSLEQSMEGGQPDEQRRALGDLQLEARQLAERQRGLAEEAAASDRAAASPDARRRLASEQDRLAERASRLENRARQLAGGEDGEDGEDTPAAGTPAPPARAREAVRELERQRVGERMAAAAESFRESAKEPGAASPDDRTDRELQRLAEAMDGVAERLEPAPGAAGEEQRIAEELSAARKLRSDLRTLGERIDDLRNGGNEGTDERGEAAAGPPAGRSGRAAELDDLREEYAERTREIARLERSAGGRQSGGASTPEGQRPSSSAPGTEAFKQDFSRWDVLHKEVTSRLERLEASLSQRLLEHAARERVRSGAADDAPDAYERAVDRYFRSLADPTPAER